MIAPRVAKVYALEIDSDLCNTLKDNLKEYSNIKIINQDVLKFNFKMCFRRLKNKIKIIGNIPYYIATPIIEHFFEVRDKIVVIFITVQKEFARRITAKPGSKEYGSLSCFIQYYTEPEILFLIKKTCFRPIPKVDSCLLRLEIRHKPFINLKNERLFFKIIRTAFNKRRKTLRNSLKDVISLHKLQLFFNQYNIDPNLRPEVLALQDFANLANM